MDSNGSFTSQQADQHFRQQDTAIASVQERQICQEEVHWCVKLLINQNKQKDEDVSTYCDQINHQEECEKKRLQLRGIAKTQKDKFSDTRLVSIFNQQNFFHVSNVNQI